jgi:predicted permease
VVIGRLAPGATLESARAAMTTISRSLRSSFGDETQAVDAMVQPLRDYLVENVRTTLIVVFAAAGLVLLIACTNLVSAQLAHGLTREREVAVRTALGASRARLVRQLFVESSMVAAGGAALGVLIAVGLVRVVKSLGAGLVPRLWELTIDARVLGFAAGLTVVTSLMIGLFPALRLSAAEPGAALRGAGRETGARPRSRIWPLLIGFEVAVAVILLIGSGLLIRTVRNILNSDVGFDPKGLISASLSPDTMPLSEVERIRHELASIPGVTGAAFVSRFPLLWGNEAGPILRPEDPRNKWPALAGFRVVSPEYFEVMRQPVVSGRVFNGGDVVGTTPVAIITPGIARTLWPEQDPIGKLIRTNYLSDQWLTVVGVVAEASSWNQPRGTQNEIYVALPQFPARAQSQLIAMVRTERDTRAMAPVVRSRLRTIAPTIPARLGTIEERITRTAADRRFAMFAVGAFGVVSLLLAGIGIYGVMSYSVVARMHEIGVRMALGATPLGIQGLVLRKAAAMALGGAIVGLVGGFAATRYINSILYGVTRLDPVAYGGGVAFLILTALVGAYVPALRSSRMDPLNALRRD